MGNICSNSGRKVINSKEKGAIVKDMLESTDDSTSRQSIRSHSDKTASLSQNTKDSEGTSKNGFVQKDLMERSSRSIKFNDTPQYFKLNMAPDVNESELPNAKSLEQQGIEDDLKIFDPVALTLCQRNIDSFETLIFQLVYENPNVKTDLDRVRAIFTWLTNKNASEAHFNYLNQGKSFTPGEFESLEMYFHGICIGRYTYAQFFQLLCRSVGIRCKLLRGYAKGNDFKPGMKLEGGKTAQHAWNSAEIDGVWYIFDTHWTARRLVGRNKNQTKPNSAKLDLFYFMIDPEEIKYSHFPFEKPWQLLKNPITLETFEKLCIIKPAFFRFGLKFLSHNEAMINTKSDIKIELGYPADAANEKLGFTFTIQNDIKNTDMYKETSLSKYGMVETCCVDKKKSIVRFWFRFPESTRYKIMIFAKSVDDQLFSGVCEYQVNVDQSQDIEKNIKPFPPTQQTTYGKTELLSKYLINSSWKDQNIITTTDGTFEVTFESSKKPDQSANPRLMARLRCNNIDETDLTKVLLIRIISSPMDASDKSFIETVKVKGYLPNIDEYALEIYANNPETESSSFFLIWQHLIISKGFFQSKCLMLSPGFILGPQDRFKELGLHAVTHPDPLIILTNPLETLPADVSIRIALPPGMSLTTQKNKTCLRILGQLMNAESKNDEESDYSNFLLQQAHRAEKEGNGDEVEFVIRVNETDRFYKLYIYAMSITSELDTVPLAMTYFIFVDNTIAQSSLKGVKLGEFPNQTNQWKEDCRLFYPLSRKLLLPSSDSVDSRQETFKLLVPQALKVAGVINNNWIQFAESPDESDIWTGSVSLTNSMESDTVLSIFANFNARYSSYIPLLEYVLVK